MTSQKQTSTIDGLFLGTARVLWQGKAPSAIAKQATTSSIHLTETGFTGDEQADLKVHGGTEKAVHHYAADHYPYWAEQYGSLPAFKPGGFGENVSTIGLIETAVFIGDVFRIGNATVQISQGRQPCWKLNEHTSTPTLAYDFQRTGKTGWYYRVLEEGTVQIGHEIRLLERPNLRWSVEEVTRARLNPKIETSVAEALSELAELAPEWRTAFAKKAKRGFKEDVTPRLNPQ